MGLTVEGHFVKIEQRGRENESIQYNTNQYKKTSHICCDDTLILMASCVFLVKVEDYISAFLHFFFV
jgi:hypothetical protein